MTGIEAPSLPKESRKDLEREKLVLTKISKIMGSLEQVRTSLEKQLKEDKESLVDFPSFVSALENLKSLVKAKKVMPLCDALDRLALIVKETGQWSKEFPNTSLIADSADSGLHRMHDQMLENARQVSIALKKVYTQIIDIEPSFKENDKLSQMFLSSLQSLRGASILKSDAIERSAF